MRRPFGITIFSIALGWLAVAGIANSFVWSLGAVRSAFDQLPSARLYLAMYNSPLLPVLCLAYGVSAATASIGLWRMRPWAHYAYAAWCVSLFVFGAFMALYGLAPSTGMVLWGSLGATAFASLGYFYVKHSQRLGTP
jgi:hypothetical protein